MRVGPTKILRGISADPDTTVVGPKSERLFGLQWQISAAVALAIITLFGVMAAIVYDSIDRGTRAAMKERLALAALSAEAIDEMVRHVSDQMESAAGLAAFRRKEPGASQVSLEEALHTMSTVETLLLVDLNMPGVWQAPAHNAPADTGWLSNRRVLAASQTGETQVFQLSPGHLDSGHPALAVIAEPVPSVGLGLKRVLVGELHLHQDARGLVPMPQSSPTSGAEIVDSQGNILAYSNVDTMENAEEHSELLAGFRNARQPGVTIHHEESGGSHVVAFAPFKSLEGGLIVEEREDVVLALPHELRRNLILYGSLAVVLIAGIAWLHAWRTLRPVKRLTNASRAIASGVMDQPVQIHRNDEIGVLAQSFEAMRLKLVEADGERLRWEEVMERRVEERTEQVHRLLASVISAQEEERKRVARELHDQAAQDLATSLVAMQSLSQASGGLKATDRATLEHAQDQLGHTLREMRRMISDLRPSALDDLGLDAAIRSYAESRAEGTGLRVLYETVGDPPQMDSVRQTAVFRILQEAVSNVVRHAEAGRLWVSLIFSEGGVAAAVQDDGKGFDLAAVGRDGDSAGRFGILGMKERASLVGGQVEVESQLGRGTEVKVWIPAAE